MNTVGLASNVNDVRLSIMNQYTKQAADFIALTNIKIDKHFMACLRYFDDDKQPRNVYNIIIKRMDGFSYKMMDFIFGDSLDNTQKATRTAPSDYDILACLDGNDPGTFEEFCDSFGYDTDSISAEKTYKKVVKQYHDLEGVFTPDELSKLAEIQ